MNRRRVIRRPLGGWNARQWRRDAFAGVIAAYWVLAAAAIVALLFRLLEIAAHGPSSI
jgi:hypothetical protein